MGAPMTGCYEDGDFTRVTHLFLAISVYTWIPVAHLASMPTKEPSLEMSCAWQPIPEIPDPNLSVYQKVK